MFILEPLIEIWRHTFPKNLRYCKQCIILHAQLSSIDKRYKERKFIPRADLAAIIDSYTPGPPIGILRLPILRNIFMIRQINMMRVYRGHPSWLFTPAVAAEHKKIIDWFDKNGNTLWVKREKFKDEVLDEFKIATQYHKVFMICVALVVALVVFLFAGALSEPLLYFYLVYVKRYDREQVAHVIAEVLEQHATTELQDSYRDKLPPAAFRKPARGDDTIFFNIVEMTSPDGNARVVFLPCPKVGPALFYRKIGAVVKSCQSVVLEEIPFESLSRIPPAYFFFTEHRENLMFPSLNVHHRVYDILSGDEDTPPPKLLPGAIMQNGGVRYLLGMTPFSIKMLYAPYFLTGGKPDAKIAWSTIKTVMSGEGFLPGYVTDVSELPTTSAQEQSEGDGGSNRNKNNNAAAATATTSNNPLVTASSTPTMTDDKKLKQPLLQKKKRDLVSQPMTQDASSVRHPHQLLAEDRIYASVAVPWTVSQITNLECSMLRAGWRVTNQSSIEWLSPKQVGYTFYDWYATGGSTSSGDNDTQKSGAVMVAASSSSSTT